MSWYGTYVTVSHVLVRSFNAISSAGNEFVQDRWESWQRIQTFLPITKDQQDKINGSKLLTN
jgi:hypothetical protein